MKNTIINVIRLSLILLFTYASVVKASDIAVFRQQLLQSPLIRSDFVPFVSYAVPVFELGVVILLLNDRTLKIGSFLSFLVMLFFSLYLIGLVTFYTKVPCSCGGILGKMSYPTHITFNIVFTLLALFMYWQSHSAEVNDERKVNEISGI